LLLVGPPESEPVAVEPAEPPADEVDTRPIWHPDVIREKLEREEAEQGAALALEGEGLRQVPALLLAEERPPTEQEMQRVEGHRWKFHGAAEFAQESQGFCSFVGCLLDLQERVQLDEEGPAMEAKLALACKTFVRGQCIGHRSGDMYHLLAHFLSNAPIFDQWQSFLTTMLQSERANEESFFTAHVEQVWSRFTRFRSVLESIFDVLDESYVWQHRFPTVSSLVNDHMKRRCFSSQGMLRNEALTGLTLRPDETLRDIRHTFGFG